MWPLALAALAALAHADTCPEAFEPRVKTVRRLEPAQPLTWAQAALGCRDLAPGFDLLARDFQGVTDRDRALCGSADVPLGLRGAVGGNVVWGTARHDCAVVTVEEAVNATYRALRQAEPETSLESDAFRVGALHLATNQWHLVANDSTFACALCQRAWVRHLGRCNDTTPTRPKPFLSAYRFHVTGEGGGNVSLVDALPLAVGRFASTGTTVAFETEGSDVQGRLVRMRSSEEAMYPWQVARAINQTFPFGAKTGGRRRNTSAITRWQDTAWCRAETFAGLDWPGTLAESTSEIGRPGFIVFTRRCYARHRQADGDFDAAWEDAVDAWLDRGAECRSQPAKSVLRALEQFAALPPPRRSTALRSLAEIMAEVPTLKWTVVDAATFYPPRSTFAHALLAALSSLVTRTAQDSCAGAYESHCVGDACAFVTDDLQATINDSQAPLAVRYGETGDPSFLRSFDADAQPRPAIALRVAPRLPSSGRVALLTLKATNVREAPLFKAIHNLVVKAAMAVVVHATSSPAIATWRHQRVWPVTFEVDNEWTLATAERYFSVWTLGDSEDTTLPCPLTKTVGSVDTFVCHSFQSASPANFTSGSFVVYHKIHPAGDLVRYIERVLLGYIGTPLDGSALQAVAGLIDRLVDDEQTLARRALTSSAVILRKASEYVDQILAEVVLSDAAVTASRHHVKVLVSDLTGSDPVVGFSLDTLAGAGAVQTITAASRNVSTLAAVDVILGAHAHTFGKQLAILAVSEVKHLYPNGSLGALIKRKLMVLHVRLTVRGSTVASPSDVHVDVQVLKGRVDEGGVDGVLLVATWRDEVSDWSVSSCAKLRSTRGAKQVFRCRHPTLAGNAFRGRYLLFEPVSFAEAVGPTLLAVLIAAGVLSGVGLTAIAGTAAALPAWRSDLGHKILLQMTLALSFNLALGFASGLVHVDAASVACVAVGALRHFSYLAMFAWLLVMSGLQLRRLFSVLGARNTSNLLLKVSAFAWGVPTVAVGSLLTFARHLYRSETADRGFCYPEGDAFTWSVQTPAAAVLGFNAVIFAVILARLYGFHGWGVTEDLRRHLNERAFQMRRLRAVFYTFCLFGIAWVFHLLAELGVFWEKFLYEYLFLMTASLHLFLLSCMFVFFDGNTRREWRSVAPLAAVSTMMISMRESST